MFGKGLLARAERLRSSGSEARTFSNPARRARFLRGPRVRGLTGGRKRPGSPFFQGEPGKLFKTACDLFLNLTIPALPRRLISVSRLLSRAGGLWSTDG